MPPSVFQLPSRHPKRKDSITSFGLRLKRVGIERGRIILNIQLMEPIQLVQHEPGPKSYSVPVAQVAVDAHGSPAKLAARRKKPAVVFKVVYSHLESIP